MAAKPASTPGWDPFDVAKIVEPGGGDKVAGFDPADRPPSQWFNWFWRLVSQWLAYLSDGALEGNHSIDGDLDVTGALDVDGAATAASIATTGNGTIGGDLGVTGAISGATVETDEADVRHGTRTLIVDSRMMGPLSVANDWTYELINGVVTEPHWLHDSAGLDFLLVPVPLEAGETITAVRVRCQQETATANGIVAQLFQSDTLSGNLIPRSDQTGTTADATRQNINLDNVVATTQTTANRFFVQIQANANIVKRIFMVEIDSTRP